MQDRSLGDEFGNLYRRIQTLEEQIQAIRSQLATTHAGNRLVGNTIIGVLPPGGGGTGYTTGSGPTIQPFINNTGGALEDGDVVVLDPTGIRLINTTTTPADILAIGVVRDVRAVGPFAAAAETPVMLLGSNATVKVTGAVAAGDYLQTSASAGEAESAGVTMAEGSFAIAETAFAGPGSGEVAAFIFGIEAMGSGPTPGGSGSSGVPGMRGRVGPRGPAGAGQANNVHAEVFFEAIIAASADTCTARLYDVTAAAAISGSDVTTTASTPTRVRSGKLALPAAEHVYRAEWGGPPAAGTFTIYSADIIVDTYIWGRRVTRSYIGLGINQSGQSVTP